MAYCSKSDGEMKTLGAFFWKCLQVKQSAPSHCRSIGPFPFRVPFSDFPKPFGNDDDNTAISAASEMRKGAERDSAMLAANSSRVERGAVPKKVGEKISPIVRSSH